MKPTHAHRISIVLAAVLSLSLVSCELNGPDRCEPVTSRTLCAYSDALFAKYLDIPVQTLTEALKGKTGLPKSFTPNNPAADPETSVVSSWTHNRGVTFEYLGMEDGWYLFDASFPLLEDNDGDFRSTFASPDGHLSCRYDGSATFLFSGTVEIRIYQTASSTSGSSRRNCFPEIDWITISGTFSTRTYTTSRD
ncbi:MAG: hypothetical protein MJY56_02775 [Bacteroidales bacterium]|nr:hypothetical protein [Bacteroidales bacterium]